MGCVNSVFQFGTYQTKEGVSVAKSEQTIHEKTTSIPNRPDPGGVQPASEEKEFEGKRTLDSRENVPKLAEASEGEKTQKIESLQSQKEPVVSDEPIKVTTFHLELQQKAPPALQKKPQESPSVKEEAAKFACSEAAPKKEDDDEELEEEEEEYEEEEVEEEEEEEEEVMRIERGNEEANQKQVEQAVVTIQAGIRGYLTRKALNQQKPETDRNKDGVAHHVNVNNGDLEVRQVATTVVQHVIELATQEVPETLSSGKKTKSAELQQGIDGVMEFGEEDTSEEEFGETLNTAATKAGRDLKENDFRQQSDKDLEKSYSESSYVVLQQPIISVDRITIADNVVFEAITDFGAGQSFTTINPGLAENTLKFDNDSKEGKSKTTNEKNCSFALPPSLSTDEMTLDENFVVLSCPQAGVEKITTCVDKNSQSNLLLDFGDESLNARESLACQSHCIADARAEEGDLLSFLGNAHPSLDGLFSTGQDLMGPETQVGCQKNHFRVETDNSQKSS